MLDSMFSFRGRIGRLQYFLRCLGLGGGVGAAAVLVMVVLVAARGPASLASALLPAGLLMLIAVPVFCWISFSLQARRIRDIGWSPVYVIPAWIAIGVIDQLVALSAPALGVGLLHRQTMVGILINLGLAGCLLFWPSRADDGAEPAEPVDWGDPGPPAPATAYDAPLRPAALVSEASPRPAAPAWNAAPVRPSFGRRGL